MDAQRHAYSYDLPTLGGKDGACVAPDHILIGASVGVIDKGAQCGYFEKGGHQGGSGGSEVRRSDGPGMEGVGM